MFGIQHEQDDWRILPEFLCAQYRLEVTSILEAAAPLIQETITAPDNAVAWLM